ncbi:unnamed protein product [Caenorhabditis angaria]|uniref:Glycosyltransferase family 92 protein n=1 Tax=Caenorhabditis angaria TaxID=860376 RepID=A0A9P1ISF1_9PELO|nr:unnamed protein product [Caenorhabditis angaria]
MLEKSTICLILLTLICVSFLLFRENSCDFDGGYHYGMSLLQLPFNISSRIQEFANSYSTASPEVPDEGTDEILNGKSILSYYKELSKHADLISSRSDGGMVLQILATYAYKDHYSAVLAIPRKMGTKVFCRYIDQNGTEIGKPMESVIYPFFVVYCSRRNDTTILAITMTENDPINTDNSKLLIRRKFKEYQHHTAFCLAPIYGKEPKWLHFVELVEHYKLQGITHFFIYIREISDYDYKIVESYEKSGEVEVIRIPDTNKDVIAQQLMAVADCLLRSRTFAKWSIFADIDERLIMTDPMNTIDKYLRNFKDESIGSIAFPQRWIMKRDLLPEKFENDDQVVNKLPTRAWHETSAPGMKGNPVCMVEQINCWAKDIVNNEKVIRMLVHEVKEFYPGYKDLFLDHKIGYIRHYRDVHMQSWEANNRKKMKQFGEMSNTSYPTVLSSQLLSGVLTRLHQVYV